MVQFKNDEHEERYYAALAKMKSTDCYACVDNDKASARFISENNLIPCNKVLADSGVKDFNELLQKTVHTRELIDKSQSAQNLPTEPSKVKPPPHSHKGRR